RARTRPGRRRPNRPSTTRRCAISSSICTGCSTRRAPARIHSPEASDVSMLSSRRIARMAFAQKAIGIMASQYLRLVWKTSRSVVEPPDIYDRVVPALPVILAMWHGQHFLMPFIKLKQHRAKVLVSHHRDGEINAIVAERLGVGTIRGSGTHGSDIVRK